VTKAYLKKHINFHGDYAALVRYRPYHLPDDIERLLCEVDSAARLLQEKLDQVSKAVGVELEQEVPFG
jgi:hypothetical protein